MPGTISSSLVSVFNVVNWVGKLERDMPLILSEALREWSGHLRPVDIFLSQLETLSNNMADTLVFLWQPNSLRRSQLRSGSDFQHVARPNPRSWSMLSLRTGFLLVS